MGKAALKKDDVRHLARLASLKITDSQLEKYPKQLSETVAFIENLAEVDTSDVSQDFFTTDVNNVFAEDRVINERSLTADEALRNSKHKKGNYFVVSRIL